jgi:hypothetical protein
MNLVDLLPALLPCESCREHTRNYIRENPPRSSRNLREWLSGFRAEIRSRVGGRRPDPKGAGTRAAALAFSAALLLFLLLGAALSFRF